MRMFSFLIGPLVLAALYCALLPLHIQGGDTAELVTASYHRLVPHPPGYPLFLWLEHIWTHLFSVSTVFWRASLLSSIFGWLALILIIYPLRTSYLAVFPCLLLGLNQEFLESSVLPDVFSLHALMVSLFLFVYLFVDEAKKYFLVPFLFFLSAANHHTTIFLLPCLVICFWDGIKSGEVKRLVLGSGVGFFVTSGLYLSLMLCHPDHALSWGNLTRFSSLAAHVLRADYGTFKLSSTNSGEPLDAFFFFFKTLLPFLPLLVFSIYRTGKFNLMMLGLGYAVILTFLFPMMMNVSSSMMGAEVLKRFHVMPLVLVMFFIVIMLKTFEITKKNLVILLVLMAPVLFVNFWQLPAHFGLRTDSVIEDYSRTMYQAASKNRPVIVMTDNDSSYFGIRYIQAFEGSLKDEVFVLSAPLLFNHWYSPKITQILPNFVLLNKERIVSSRELNIADDLVKPNLERIHFLTNKDYKTGEGYKVTFMELGRLVERGSGVYFSDEVFKNRTAPDFSGPQAFTKGYLFYQYAHYYFAKGHSFSLSGDEVAANEIWLKSIQVVPYAYPAMMILCQNKSERYPFCEEKNLQKMEQKTKGFF
jgi:hypothetical protein